jgi:acyl-CoA dehydrogenase
MTQTAHSSPTTTEPVGERLFQIAEQIGETVVGPSAWDVDRQARFPSESLGALKDAKLLSALVPVEQGGLGARITDVSNTIRVLSRYCAATGSVLAMHTEQMFLLLKHGNTSALRRLVDEVVEKQLLIANANSEVGLGGDVMRSLAALEPEGDGWRFDKQALAASYARHADLILSTARRADDATETDQVVAMLRASEMTLEETTGWDTLGLRGTCSSGMHITGHVTSDDLFPVPFAEMASRGGGQMRHILLTAVWTGLAEGAMREAHKTVRAAARRDIGTTSQSAMRLAEILTDVQCARATLAQAQGQIEAAIESDTLDDIGLITNLRNVKIVTTTTAVRVAGKALQICSINGYRRGPDHPLERILRDAYGGLIMVGNDRYLAENAQMLPVRSAL